MTNPATVSNRLRGIYVLLGLFVFALGIVSRVFPVGSIYWDKYLGDLLYAVMFYLCLGIIWPTGDILRRCVLTAVFVICIECFQLTGIPLRMRQSEDFVSKLISIVLGTKFGWGDMLAYFVGLALIAGIDRRIKKGCCISEETHQPKCSS